MSRNALLTESTASAGQTRAERYEQIVALRDQGLLWREIGERLGISLKTANQIYHDPTGEKTWARKAKNNGVCVDCGGETKDSGSLTPPERCSECARRHRYENRYWTPGRIVQELQAWASDLGRPPKATEALTAGARVTCSLVQDEFGSWNAGLEAAGLPTNPNKVPQAELDRTVALYRSGLSLKQVAAELGLSGMTVHYRLVVAGEPRRPARRPKAVAA